MGNSLCLSHSKCHHGVTPLEMLIAVTGVISMICCIMIILTYFLWPHLQTTTRKLLVYLSIADYTFAACNVIGALRNAHGPCNASDSTRNGEILSIIGTYAACCSYFWTMFLAVYLYLLIVKNNSSLAERLFPVFHFTGWGVPGIAVGLAASRDVLGCSSNAEVTGGWCWVILNQNGHSHSHVNNVIWMLVTAKLWELLAYFVIFILYFRIKCHFRKERGRPGQLITRASYASAQYIDRKLTFIPVAFILLRMWGMIRFILYTANPKLIECNTGYIKDTGWLVYVQGIGDTAQGIANWVFFCLLTTRVRRQWLDCYCCCSCKPCSKHGTAKLSGSGISRGSSPTPPLFNVDDSQRRSDIQKSYDPNDIM